MRLAESSTLVSNSLCDDVEGTVIEARDSACSDTGPDSSPQHGAVGPDLLQFSSSMVNTCSRQAVSQTSLPANELECKRKGKHRMKSKRKRR